MSSAHDDAPHSRAATGPGQDDTEEESTLEEEPPGSTSPDAPEPGAPPEPGSPEPPEEASTLEQEPVDRDEDKQDDVVRVRDAVDPGSVRRAPRYGRFAFAGLALGVLIAFLVYQLPVDPMINARALLLVLVILLGSVGIGAGYVLALLIDRRTLRARTSD